MLKREVGCCGLVKAQPINNEILSKFECSLLNNERNYHHGVIKVLKEGLTFEEIFFNPFKSKVYILIPNSDIKFIDTKTFTSN
jgi:hypothetical protein